MGIGGGEGIRFFEKIFNYLCFQENVFYFCVFCCICNQSYVGQNGDQ